MLDTRLSHTGNTMFGNNRRLREELSELKEKLQRQQALTNALDRSNSRIEFRPDGSIVNANDNFLRTMGYTLAEISGQHHRIFCDSKLTGSPEYEKFWQRLRQGEYVAGRFKRLRKDAQPVWLEASYNPILDSNGQVLGIVKLATDITQEVLQEQDQKARLAAIDRAMAVIEFDLEGNILTANDNFLTTMGYRAADIKGRQHRMFCDAELANSPDYARFWQRLSAGEVISGRVKRLPANGSIAWLEANYNPVLDAEGKPCKIIKFATDITAEIERMDSEIRNADEALDISRGNQDLSEQGASVIEEAANKMLQIANAAQDAASTIEELGQQSSKITSIVQTIREIADQTNLLALNAAIEAARAGEQGRGFAVVADEVRKLAERTSASTSEISAMIDKVQSGTRSAMDSMARTLAEANASVTLASQAADSIGSIRDGARRIVEVVEEVGRNLRQQG